MLVAALQESNRFRSDLRGPRKEIGMRGVSRGDAGKMSVRKGREGGKGYRPASRRIDGDPGNLP